MTLKNPETKFLVETTAFVLEQKARKDEALQPWRDALVHLQSGEVEAASEVAAKAYSNGASLEDRRSAIDMISLVAVESGSHGHWFESLLVLAAEGGLSHCAYNVGNLISDRAESAADHALAQRYYTQAIKNATAPSIKASALTNSCIAIRDGLITGTPDWEKAVAIYEQAAELNLAVGMFNAGNVSCWLKDKGQREYAARAEKWFTRLIERVEADGEFVDIGGEAEVRDVYRRAKSALAELHALDQVESVDIDFILSEALKEPDACRAAWLRIRGYEHLLRKTEVQSKPSAWENWHSVLALLGWELDGQPTQMSLGPGTGDSRILKFKRERGAPLALAVVDLDEIESNGGLYRLVKLAKDMQASHPGPCLAIGAKGLFVQIEHPERLSSYTVLVSSDSRGAVSLVPLWPGATTDDVAKLVEEKGRMLDTDKADEGNTIAILVNALGVGMSMDGRSFPAAIYVNVGGYFNSPVMTVEQAKGLGCALPENDLAKELAEVKAYFQGLAQRKLEYLGLQ